MMWSWHWLMKSQTSLGSHVIPYPEKSHSDQNFLFPQNPTKKHNSVDHNTDRQKSGGFLEKVFSCSATFWQEVRSPRSFCQKVENAKRFRKTLPMPILLHLDLPKLANKCHQPKHGIIRWKPLNLPFIWIVFHPPQKKIGWHIVTPGKCQPKKQHHN